MPERGVKPDQPPGSLCAMPHVVLLFGLEMWVMTPCMGRALGSFQHIIARQITGIQPKRQVDGSWEYQPLDTVMEEEGFEEMG